MNIPLSNTLFIKLANLIAILGNGIAWTGLGYELSIKFSDPRFMGLLQALSVVANVTGPIIGVSYTKRFSIDFAIVSSNIISALCCIVLSFFISQTSSYNNFYFFSLLLITILLVLLFNAINSMCLEPYYGKIVEQRDGSTKNVQNEFANFSCFGIFGKLCGMSAGPLIFSFLGHFSLLINSITFMISAFICWVVTKKINLGKKVDIKSRNNFSFSKFIFQDIKNPTLFETAIANSLIFVIVLALSTQAMKLKASAFEMALFWFGATICSFSTHFLLSRSKKFSSLLFEIEHRFGSIQIVPIIIAMVFSNVYVLIVCQWIFSLLNPLATNQSRTNFYNFYGADDKFSINAYALRNIISNIIILLFSCLIFFFNESINGMPITGLLCCLILSRWSLSFYARTQLKNINV